MGNPRPAERRQRASALDQSGTLALVHNGIIENYAELRHRLVRHDHKFSRKPTRSVFAHLVVIISTNYWLAGKTLTQELVAEATLAATREATGSYAIALVHSGLQGFMLGARRGSPLVVGVGKDENFLASDVSPVIAHTRKVIYLHDGDIVSLTHGGVSVTSSRRSVRRAVTKVEWSAESAQLGKFPHYMLKEIYEQPERVEEVVSRTVRPRLGSVAFRGIRAFDHEHLAKVRRLLLVACGTSWHACLAGELIESLAHLPVEVECASEMRYRHRPLEKSTLVVSLPNRAKPPTRLPPSASRARTATALAIVNVADSIITARESDAEILMRAGPEIGVASTKAFEMVPVSRCSASHWAGNAAIFRFRRDASSCTSCKPFPKS